MEAFTFNADTLERIEFTGGYFDGQGKAHFLFTDWQGNVTMTTDAGGRLEQHTGYYPYGEPWREPAGQHAKLFAGKERVTGVPGGDYDFGPRGYRATTTLWDSWDIHAADYAMWSPWMYCGGNPIRFVDPTGKKWDDPKQAEKLKKNIEKKISSTKDKISEQNQEMAKNKASGKDYSKQENKIADLNERITNLEKSKSDIDLLGKDSNIYKFRKVSGDGAHYVKLGKDGKIIIETSEDAFSVHEIGHVRQSLESGGLEFNDSGYLINSGTRESPGKQYDAISKAEIEAYQIQYSYRPASLPKRIRNIFEIDVHYVGSIMNPDGSVGYPVIRDYSNYLKNLPKNAE